MMKKTAYTGTFFLCLLINIVLNFRLTVPGWILLILHFIFPAVSVWWSVGYFGAFLLYMLIWQLVWRLIGRIGPLFRYKQRNASEKTRPERGQQKIMHRIIYNFLLI